MRKPPSGHPGLDHYEQVTPLEFGEPVRDHPERVGNDFVRQTGEMRLRQWLGAVGVGAMANHRVTLIEHAEGVSMSCPALRGCHSQGRTREEALTPDEFRKWL